MPYPQAEPSVSRWVPTSPLFTLEKDAQQELEEKNRFRATMALLWTIVSLITVLQYMLMGTLNRESLRLFAAGVLPVLSGIFAGGLLCRRLSQRAFAYVINILIMFAGMISLCR